MALCSPFQQHFHGSSKSHYYSALIENILTLDSLWCVITENSELPTVDEKTKKHNLSADLRMSQEILCGCQGTLADHISEMM
jgi:hypothetical protein